jgi:hypothetical protein
MPRNKICAPLPYLWFFTCHYLSRLTILYIRHIVITDRGELKSVTLLTPAKAIFLPSSLKTRGIFFKIFNFNDIWHGYFIILFYDGK